MAVLAANNCSFGAGADVTIKYMIDYCDCPGDTPVAPVKLEPLVTGSRSINETRTEIEDPNAFGGSCTKSVSDGAEADLPFTHSFCGNQPLFDMGLGMRQEPNKIITGADIQVTDTAGTYSSAAIDFYARGLRPGMMVQISGHANAANNGFKYVKTVDSDGATPWTFTVFTDATTTASTEYPATVVEAAGPTVTLDGDFITYTGNENHNVIIERYFPNVTSGASTGLYQYALGGAVDGIDFTVEPGNFVTGSLSLTAPSWSGNNTASIGEDAGENVCACDEKIFFDPQTNRNIDIFYNGDLVCAGTVTWSLERTVNVNKTSCETIAVPGKISCEASVVYPFTDDTFLNAKATQTAGVFSVIFWNDARTQYENWSFTAANVSDDTIDPDDEDQLFQEVNLQANDNSAYENNACMFLQRSVTALPAPRNRITGSATTALAAATGVVTVTGGTAGDVITVQTVDSAGTITNTNVTKATTGGAEAITLTFPAAGTGTFTISSSDDLAWTAIDFNMTAAADTWASINTCYVRPALTTIAVDEFSGTELDFSEHVSLTSVTVTTPGGLTDLNVTNSPVTTLSANGAALTEASVNAILQQMGEVAIAASTVDVSGGTSAAPTGVGTTGAGIITGLGGTATTN